MIAALPNDVMVENKGVRNRRRREFIKENDGSNAVWACSTDVALIDAEEIEYDPFGA